MDRTSLLDEYANLVAGWPGLIAQGQRDHARELVDDSLALLPHLDGVQTLLDVGTGGGMPGIPLAISRPDLRVTLLEADHRKAAFCTHAAGVLRLDLAILAERAEDAAHGPFRETFDAVTARALAPFPELLELCLPFVRPGGRLLAMRTAGEPLDGAWERLGGSEPEIMAAPTGARDRGVVVVVHKVNRTPPELPRRPGEPHRHPLLN
ncbi:MAG: 16S rRNA (guanine(527)-N(7))-methyltransferase RsmG [Candidatus Dormibacteraeota bacterium]|nr:16S rRNA (guanine(527)-N(7))-methyltransferase RsmG [Candidatus Dormibacteraeota bacterium]MBO0744359.1 16S rRNA (guanine(527)-N(7))-methyltransferase RsmG [Candidatus Dormibacteraeota bacterium]